MAHQMKGNNWCEHKSMSKKNDERRCGEQFGNMVSSLSLYVTAR